MKSRFCSDANDVEVVDSCELSIERDDSNVFEDSESAIVVSVTSQTATTDAPMIGEGPGYFRVVGMVEQEIDLTFKLDTARRIHETLGELLAEAHG